MTLDEARNNFGRRVTYTSGTVTETGEIRGIWYSFVQILVGDGLLRLVEPEALTLC